MIGNLIRFALQILKNQQINMKIFPRLKQLPYSLLTLILILSAGCKGRMPDSSSDETNWILRNEVKIETELNSRISLRIIENEKYHPNWVEESMIVTEYDSTILGSLAKMIKKLNKCFYVEYTYTPDLNKRKVITITRDENCTDTTEGLFSLIDSTRYFKITFDTLH